MHLRSDQRNKHMYVCGATRAGKTKLLERMVQQDITRWPLKREGLVVFDPKGGLYRDLVRWLAYEPSLARDRPIVLLDIAGTGAGEGTPAAVPHYNPLRWRRGTDPNTVIDRLVQSVAYVWGSPGTNETPRLERWLKNVFWVLYVNKRPITDAFDLINDAEFRRRMMVTVDERSVVLDWARADHRSGGGGGGGGGRRFEEMIESTENRLRRLTMTARLKLVFGGNGGAPSFDWTEALANDAIVLVNLAGEGGHLSEVDTQSVGALLLADLWHALQHRGENRRDGDKRRPFQAYLDEFQKFVTPDIADSLDLAAGYGLNLVLSHQFPKQLEHKGDAGKQVLDSIIANVGTQVAFKCRHVEDRERLAKWMFGDSFDVTKVRHEIHATRAIDTEVVYHPSFGQSETWGENESFTKSVARSFSETHGQGTSDVRTRARSSSRGRQGGGSRSSAQHHAENWARAHQRSTMRTTGIGESETFGGPIPDPAEGGRYPANSEEAKRAAERGGDFLGKLFPFLSEDLEVEHPRSRTYGKSESTAEGIADTESAGGSTGSTDTQAATWGWNQSDTDSFSEAHGVTSQHSYTQGITNTESHTVGTSYAYTESVNFNPMLVPVYARELASRAYESIADQIVVACQQLSRQEPRFFYAKLDGFDAPVALEAFEVEENYPEPEDVAVLFERVNEPLPFMRTPAQAIAAVKEAEADTRRQGIEGTLAEEDLNNATEPTQPPEDEDDLDEDFGVEGVITPCSRQTRTCDRLER
ncbi:MAG: TraM recognition domain-containing protein [Planctomycetota bacterium]